MEGTRIGPFLVHEKLGPYKRHHVYRATQLEQQRDVALKFIKVPPKTPPAQAISRIQRETKILKQLDHPNLVKVHGAGIENGNIFFALDLVEGEPLSSILSRRSKLAWELACDYARQIACCLEYLHSQELIHLKLTPDKILITPDGQVKITDLRLNRSKRKRWDSVKKKSLDTAAYMPPEQFAGEQGTAKSDFYSLGVILFEMLTGKLPHTADSFQAIAKQKANKPAPLISQFTLECPMWMEKVVSTLLAINPAERPFSARSIIVALDDVKRADSQGTGVAEKMVSGFSPLTVGKDKSEAKKALGIKKKKRKEDNVPLLQNTGFLVASLATVVLLMIGTIAFINWPSSPSQLMDRAQRQAQNGDNYDAQQTLLEILKRNENEYTDDAEIMLVNLRTQKLIEKAERHPTWHKNTTKGPIREFFKAYEYEQVERYDDALNAYDTLLTTVSFDNFEERHIVNAALERKVIIEERKKELARERIRNQNNPAQPQEDPDKNTSEGADEKSESDTKSEKQADDQNSDLSEESEEKSSSVYTRRTAKNA